VKVLAAADGPDFVDHNLDEDPGAGGATPEDFQSEETQLELDLFFAKHLPGAEVTPTATYFREPRVSSPPAASRPANNSS
jgi:hypothetical protein